MNNLNLIGRLQVQYWPVDRLIPYARNARTHSPAQVAEIAGSIRAFGFANPILTSADSDVIAGHGRLAAARQLGMTEVPVIVLDGLSEQQRRQLVLADNRIALNAGWDMEMLRLELTELATLGADLLSLGFSEKELATALNGAGASFTDENEIPAVLETAVAQAGEIWCLGPHRIGCGDSTDAALVASLLAGASPQLMVTDPPYGVEYDPEWRHRIGVNKSAKARQDPERRTCRLGSCLVAIPWRDRLRLARRTSRRHRRREFGENWIYDPLANRLG